MRAAVHLDDQPPGWHDEVGDVVAEHHLPAHLDAELTRVGQAKRLRAERVGDTPARDALPATSAATQPSATP